MKTPSAFWVALLLSAVFSSPSLAAEPVVPGNPNPSVEQIMKATPGTSGVFEPQPDGSVRHVQSGFVWPAKLPNANLWALLVFASPLGPGNDVGCSYGRAKGQTPESKVTIFVVKAAAGTTLDSAFARHQDELQRASPNARILGEAIRIRETGGRTLPPVRSQEAEILLGNRKFIDQLIVGVVGGWIVKIRATFPSEFSLNDSTAGIDLPASAFIWTTAVTTFSQRTVGR